jgi:RimJ/RimL family protein N-acetyltransferase
MNSTRLGCSALFPKGATESTETVKNGVKVTIRAVRPDDKAAIVEAFGLLEPESIYTRFFQYKKSLSNLELKAATEVDFENVVALVVTTESQGKNIIIGSGRYLIINPTSDEQSAEIAFVVEEDYHGLGIAGRILKHLVRIAREKGVCRFEAEVLPKNQAMLKVFSRIGLPMTESRMDGTIHVTLSLTERPDPTITTS